MKTVLRRAPGLCGLCLLLLGLALAACGPKKSELEDAPAGEAQIATGMLYYDCVEKWGDPTSVEGGDPSLSDPPFNGTCVFNTPEGTKTVVFANGVISEVR